LCSDTLSLVFLYISIPQHPVRDAIDNPETHQPVDVQPASWSRRLDGEALNFRLSPRARLINRADCRRSDGTGVASWHQPAADGPGAPVEDPVKVGRANVLGSLS